ncbi:MAG TPA: 3-dehydroquinate synthase [Bryobacteraceae bacterium]|nr:3-dehydroquinate synthase [Bryobacteraceae bacterium]
MPCFRVETPHGSYSAIVERGILRRVAGRVPPNRGKVFVISSEDVWRHQGEALARGLEGVPYERIFLPGGEENKRLAPLEAAAEEMVRRGADRTSLVIAFGGGIVTDMGGFLAAMFMRGIPVINAPTTLLAQVDAAIGGKTGVNLAVGKNLAGSFHQPLEVWIDPGTLDTLPEREYRAGLYEIIKAGVIRDPGLFAFLAARHGAVLQREADAVDRIIADSVRIKAEVVTADERESGLRRILNFGHTFGHALEAETAFTRLLHGEAVAFGMRAAVHLGLSTGSISTHEGEEILRALDLYGPIPPLDGIAAENLLARLVHDKKTIRGSVHFVLPVRIGEVEVASGIDSSLVLQAIRSALQ